MPHANATVGRSAQLGATVVRVLQQSLELHRERAHGAAESTPHRSDAHCRGRAHGRVLSLVHRRTSRRSEAAALRPTCARTAVGLPVVCPSADRDDAGAALAEHEHSGGGGGGGGGGSRGGADEAGEGAAAAEGEVKAFRDLYMQILAEGVGDELDAVRREGDGRGGKVVARAAARTRRGSHS